MATTQTSLVDDVGLGTFFAAAVVVVIGVLAVWQVFGVSMALVGIITLLALLAVGGLFLHMYEEWDEN